MNSSLKAPPELDQITRLRPRSTIRHCLRQTLSDVTIGQYLVCVRNPACDVLIKYNILSDDEVEEEVCLEMRCYRKILRISYKDHVTNEEVRAKIQQAIGPHEDLLTVVKRRKLQWYGHVSRSSGLAKTILQGTVKGGRRQGGRKQRWKDNIREWTGLEFTKSQRAVEDREKWRKLVAKSSVVPQRPSRLRD